MASFSLPALFVAFGGLRRTEQLGQRDAKLQNKLVVYCAAYNSRNERAQRHGDQHEVGSYQLAEDVAQLLANQTFGLGIHPLRLDQIEPLFNARRNDAKAISVMAVHLHADFVMRAAMPDCALVPGDEPIAAQMHPDQGSAVAGILEAIASGFYLRPGDDEPDTDAHVTLEA